MKRRSMSFKVFASALLAVFAHGTASTQSLADCFANASLCAPLKSGSTTVAVPAAPVVPMEIRLPPPLPVAMPPVIKTEPVPRVATTKPTPSAAPRVAHALVIGNANYGGSARLKNPINDAAAMSTKLRSLGFEVTEVLDGSHADMIAALSRFSVKASRTDLTLLFYAGHGVQVSGVNYMLPIDLNMADVAQAPLKGISLSLVVDQYLPGKTRLVFLDACRDNPLMQVSSRSISRGLAPVNTVKGTMIAFSTKDGQVAQDGNGVHSPFTAALLSHLDDPDDIAVVMRKVRERVLDATEGQQEPWEYGSLTGGALVLSDLNRASRR
jgi:hypothetical protein